ncbi:hypothetical protein [Lysinibacillus cavernae]|uniref:hypothetical protein n=1 Tax=Lysinibacillus cavernae TaxID=2666135 RepID=UPI0012D9BDEF|nr:hypothetical protein [Lysinibacillus cavernae]
MNRKEILNYFQTKIPSYELKANQNKHILQFDLYVHPFFSNGRNTHFITQFSEVLEFIDSYVENYAQITIDSIASYPKSEPQQFFQRVAEVYVLFNLLNIEGVDRNSVILEPSARNQGKNPEYRIKIKDIWYAFEVKTPDHRTFENRQQGVQTTTRLSEKEVSIIKRYKTLSYTKDNKVKDFIKSADEKFSEYKTSSDYSRDIKILVIVWDDFINEVVSSLINPHAGILTNKSFASDISFENIDGILISRFLTPLKRVFYFGEVFKENNGYIQSVFKDKYNIKGLSITLSDSFNPLIFFKNFRPYTIDIEAAEYHPTDFIDWESSIGVIGLNNCPQNIKESLLKHLMKLNYKKEIYSFNYINFGLVNINKIWDNSIKDSQNLNNIRGVIEFSKLMAKEDLKSPEINLKTFEEGALKYKEVLEKEYNNLVGTEKLCKCNSGRLFKDCCEINLKNYEYVTFFER